MQCQCRALHRRSVEKNFIQKIICLCSADPSVSDMHCYPIIVTASSPLASALGKLKTVYLVFNRYDWLCPRIGRFCCLPSIQSRLWVPSSALRLKQTKDFFPAEEFSLSLIAAAAEINKQTAGVVVSCVSSVLPYYFSYIWHALLSSVPRYSWNIRSRFYSFFSVPFISQH